MHPVEATETVSAGGANADNETAKNENAPRSYRIQLRMDDGKVRTIYQHDRPTVAAGDHIRIVDGLVVQQS